MSPRNTEEALATNIRLYAIYDHPTDYPDNWVVRELDVGAGTVGFGEAQLADSLEEARGLLPAGAELAQEGDPTDPNIAEVWAVRPG